MIRALTASSILILSAALGVATPASAQSGFFRPTFEPPLAEPNPVGAPVAMALLPGARAECASREWVEGAPPRPGQARVAIAVEAAQGGVRLLVREPQYDMFDYAVLLGDDGAVALEEARVLGEPAPEAETLAGDLLALTPELRLHGRALVQGDALFDNAALAPAFVRLTASIGGASSTPMITGGALLTGESRADGRRVLVFDYDMTIASAPQELAIRLDGYEAFDVETGLRLYADVVLEVETAPPGRSPAAFVIRQEVVCALADGSG